MKNAMGLLFILATATAPAQSAAAQGIQIENSGGFLPGIGFIPQPGYVPPSMTPMEALSQLQMLPVDQLQIKPHEYNVNGGRLQLPATIAKPNGPMPTIHTQNTIIWTMVYDPVNGYRYALASEPTIGVGANGRPLTWGHPTIVPPDATHVIAGGELKFAGYDANGKPIYNMNNHSGRCMMHNQQTGNTAMQLAAQDFDAMFQQRGQGRLGDVKVGPLGYGRQNNSFSAPVDADTIDIIRNGQRPGYQVPITAAQMRSACASAAAFAGPMGFANAAAHDAGVPAYVTLPTNLAAGGGIAYAAGGSAGLLTAAKAGPVGIVGALGAGGLTQYAGGTENQVEAASTYGGIAAVGLVAGLPGIAVAGAGTVVYKVGEGTYHTAKGVYYGGISGFAGAWWENYHPIGYFTGM